MSIPTSVEAIAIIVLVFIPGYVFLQFTKSAVAFVPQTVDARYFFAVITWGGLIHITASHWTIPVLEWYQNDQLDEHVRYVLIWAVLTLGVGPLIAGIVGAWLVLLPWINRILGSIGMDYVSRTPTAWNYSIKTGAGWVRVHLQDGTVIGGVYGPKSFADDTDEQDLFLEQVYNLTDTGDFGEPVRGSAGVWIPHDVISHVMFFRVEEGENQWQTEQPQSFDNRNPTGDDAEPSQKEQSDRSPRQMARLLRQNPQRNPRPQISSKRSHEDKGDRWATIGLLCCVALLLAGALAFAGK